MLTPFSAKREKRIATIRARIDKAVATPMPPAPEPTPAEALKRANADYLRAWRAGDLDGQAKAARAQRSARYRVARQKAGEAADKVVGDLWAEVPSPMRRVPAPLPVPRDSSAAERGAMGVQEFLERHYRRAAIANRNRLGARR